MIHIAVRVRELVSSNVDNLVGKASDPAKMLKLLRTEIEENLIGLQGELSRAKRESDALAAEAKKATADADAWTDKAKVAMDHGREDLARSALLAREDERKRASDLAARAGEAKSQVRELEQTMATLEEKLSETRARLACMQGGACTPSASDHQRPSRSQKALDKIASLEKRVDYIDSDRHEPRPASVEAEIAQLGMDAAINAELDAMRSGSKPKAKKASGAKRKRA